jgi:hypothetical protein
MWGVGKVGTIWLFLAASLAWGQDLIGPKGPTVTMVPAPIIGIPGGKPGQVQLQFRVVRGYHVNSNKPKAEFLIPTALKLDAPTDIVVGKISYPPGQDMSFPFSPDEKLSVYSGDFLVAVMVRPLHTVIPGKYMLRGKLRYQACDKAACYPPKELPVQFEVKVAKAVAPRKGNPAQSPHVHR